MRVIQISPRSTRRNDRRLSDRLKITSHFRFVVTTLVVMMTKVITTNLFLDDYLVAANHLKTSSPKKFNFSEKVNF